jgi:hypothetical protein
MLWFGNANKAVCFIYDCDLFIIYDWFIIYEAIDTDNNKIPAQIDCGAYLIVLIEIINASSANLIDLLMLNISSK